ncbi:SET domain-containing protein SmydA-8-like [Ischnura elegans]|uniref:SET domain-containing protein SmydA-8-like n=1 Tax=Ischnura elegans TaxID=197161 RepID=UPI001ED86D65|nr:SET domain-containing protein SmydA-8-like [Ischnura elegans]
MAPCELCGAENASTTCLQCCNASYCSKEHQEKHKEVHGKACHPYIIKQSEVLGRYLAASRDVKGGELLHRESPAAVGPQPGSPPLCMGCLNKISGLTEDSRFYHCPVCRVAPFCCASCPNNMWHSQLECATIASLNRKHGALQQVALPPQTVLPLRCYLLQSTNPQQWTTFMELEGHLEARKGTLIWKSVDEGIVYILYKLGLISSKERDLFQKICAILDVNSFEVRGPEGDPLRAIYPTAALLSHDCLPSTCIAHEPSDVTLIIRAAFDLKCGDLITHNYAGTLVSTIERRESLRKGKYFECTCKRCQDPYELGTNLGSLKCPKCSKGPVVSKNPLDQSSAWMCQECKHEISGALAAVTHSVARTVITECDQDDVEEVEMLLFKLKKSFYPGNAVLLEVGQLLAGLYNEDALQWEISNRPYYPLRRRWELCKELLETLSKLEPGISRTKGVCMYEMASAALALASRCIEREDHDLKEIKLIIEKSECLLQQSIANFLYEPEGSPERKLIYSAASSIEKCRHLASQISNRT